jgi:hypothetical protein
MVRMLKIGRKCVCIFCRQGRGKAQGASVNTQGKYRCQGEIDVRIGANDGGVGGYGDDGMGDNGLQQRQ